MKSPTLPMPPVKSTLAELTQLLLLVPILVLALTFKVNAQEELETIDKRIDSLFSNYNGGTPGVAVAVVKNGKVILKKGYGAANLEYGVPISPNTIFHVASVSKQFTAFSIYLLEKEGRLSLEDDVRKYLPELPKYGKPIKIKHLLGHSSGLRDQWALLTLAGWRMDDIIETEQILKLVVRQTALNFETGASFGYSNSGYTLLAEIVKRVTGQSFVEFSKENIFNPLGMTNTFFHEDYRAIVKNRAYSYEKRNGKYVKKELNFSTIGPTSLFTTVEDLAKWANNFDHPIVGDRELITRFNAASLLDNGNPIIWSISNGDTTYHAKGQLFWRYRGTKIFTHGGHDAGFRAWLARMPEEDLSIITLSNDEHYEILKSGQQIADVFLENNPAANTTAPGMVVGTYDQPAKFRANLDNFEGEFASDELLVRYEIKVKDNKLVMTNIRLSDIELTQIGDYKFSGVNTFAFELEFLRQHKAISAFKISNFGVKGLVFKKVSKK